MQAEMVLQPYDCGKNSEWNWFRPGLFCYGTPSGQWHQNMHSETHTHIQKLTASWKHKYRPQLWDTALFLAYPTENQDKHLVRITLSYLVMQKSFIDKISKMAEGKTRNYGRNCMLQNLWCTYWKMKNVYDLIITFQSICLINPFLLYRHLYTFIYFLSHSQPKNMWTSSRLCWLVARHHQRDSSRFQLSPPSLHHGHGVILKVDHTVDMCFGELHLCVCVYV